MLRLSSAAGKGTVAATVIGSGIVFLDGTVVNVALPAMGEALRTDLSGLQWAVDAYLLTLSALLLLGGAVSDQLGRRKMFVFGLVGFALASVLCGLAPTLELLVLARATQGIAGALLVPGSLALLRASFVEEDQGRAIGLWAGLSGVTTAVGPVLGGWLVEAASWRWIFFLNLPVTIVGVAATLRWVPESRDESTDRKPDIWGALLATVGLSGLTYGFIEGPSHGFGSPLVLGTLALGVVAMVAFVIVESRLSHPMLPLSLFRSPQFTAANVLTLGVYAALGGATFLLAIFLQRAHGYSALEAGGALVPVTVMLLVLSPIAGRLAQQFGPEKFVLAGALLCGLAMFLFAQIDAQGSYFRGVLPGVLVLGLGLSVVVAPLTSWVLSSVDERHAGIASGVNNAVSRIAGLFAVALLPALGGIAGTDPAALTSGFARAMLASAVLCVVSGVGAFALARAKKRG